MDENKNRRKSDRWRSKPIIISFILVVLIFLAVLIGFSKVLRDVQNNSGRINGLVKENSSRIKEIQLSRIESCEKTYNGIRDVFLTFFPPPKLRTPDQVDRLEEFNTNINKLVKACVKQTKPKPIKKGGKIDSA